MLTRVTIKIQESHSLRDNQKTKSRPSFSTSIWELSLKKRQAPSRTVGVRYPTDVFRKYHSLYRHVESDFNFYLTMTTTITGSSTQHLK